MKVKMLLTTMLATISLFTMTASAQVTYEHVRNATGKLTYNDTTILIDPMLAEKGRYEGFQNCFNPEVRNPVVELLESKEKVLENVDAVIVTHTHLDHWDEVAQSFIQKDILLFAQDEQDAAAIRKEGFTNVHVLTKGTKVGDVTVDYIEGTHGTKEMYDNPDYAAGLGNSMGMVFSAPNERTTYVMGDTVWTPRVDKTIFDYHPDLIVMNTGYAKSLLFNDGIIMGTEDVGHAAKLAPDADIITVHMDAINHCTVSRSNMREYVKSAKLRKRVHVPNDGEKITFPSKK